MRARRKPDDKNPDVNIIAVGSGSVGLPSKKYYDKNATVANYTRTIAQMFQIMWTGTPISNDSIFKDPEKYMDTASQIVQFEKKLANASPDQEVASEPAVSFKLYEQYADKVSGKYHANRAAWH